MQRKSFQERLEEIYQTSGLKWAEMARALKISSKQLLGFRKSNNIRISSVESVAEGFGLIPVVLYRIDNEQVEDLGIEGFLHGEDVDNYIGRVLAKRRSEKGLYQRELAKRLGLRNDSTVSLSESGRRGFTEKRLERFAKELDLVPGYLVERLQLSE